LNDVTKRYKVFPMKIRERVNTSGGTSWALDYGLVNGRRKVAAFKKKADAVAALNAAKQERQKFGHLAPMLSPVEVADFLTARDRLAGCGASVQEAVDYYLKHAAVVRESVLVPELVKRFLDLQADRKNAVRAQQSYRTALGALSRWLPMKAANEVQKTDVEHWLNGSGWAAKTRNSRLGYASSMFNWGITKGLLAKNPCVGIERIKLVSDEIGTLKLGECEKLLSAAIGTRLLPYVVFGMFCGIRRAELERLTWDSVNVSEATIILEAKNAKTRRRRVVDLCEAALAWLALVPAETMQAEVRIVPSDFKDIWREFREKAGIAQWPNNALRHTFASMHYAWHQNENKLQAQMGHTSAKMLFENYRALVKKTEAEKFWALRPR